MGGGGVCGVVMPKYFYGFEKMLGGLCQNILWGVEKCLGGMPTNFVYGFEKKKLGGGWLCPNILLTLKNVGGGMRPHAKTF